MGAKFGALVREARLASGKTQASISNALRVSVAYVSAIEHGNGDVSPLQAARFAKALGANQAEYVQLVLQDRFDAWGLNLTVKVERQEK